MAGFLGSGSSSFGNIELFYKSLMPKLKSTSVDINYSPGSGTAYNLTAFMMCRNLTVGANATLQANPFVTTAGNNPNSVKYLICDTLTVDGVIDAGQYQNGGGTSSGVSGGSNAGGNGAGSIIIVARSITGTGLIRANGANGQGSVTSIGSTATGYVGINNGSCALFNNANPGGSNPGMLAGNIGGTNTNGAGGATPFIVGGDSSNSTYFGYLTWGFHLRIPTWLNMITQYADAISTGGTGVADLASPYFYAGGGSSGGTTSSTSASAGGGGGGGGFFANGGYGGLTSPGLAGNAGGGGGGGGGAIWIFSENPLPSGLRLQATGGNGGQGFDYGGGGGGGGGGYLGLWVPSNSATTNVNGGNGGAPGSMGTNNTPAQAGQTGLIDVMTFTP